MRPTEFRGLRKDGTGWEEGSLVLRRCDGVIRTYIYNSSVDETELEEYDRNGRHSLKELFIEVIPETVGQLTGLKDKNGEWLNWWEGDLFCIDGTLKVIVKDNGCFWFESVKSKCRTLCYETIDWAGIESCKIGNIHQNPELMKG